MINKIKDSFNTNRIIHTVYFCIIGLIIIIFLYIFHQTDAIKTGSLDTTINTIWENGVTISISIICSILASIIYAYIMNQQSDEERKNLASDLKQVCGDIYDERIDDGLQRISQNIMEIYNNTADMMPSRYYRSADHPNQEFNSFLNKKIAESKKFVYYGESARFTCKRLYNLKDKNDSLKNLKIEIYMVNPACVQLFESNKTFLMLKENNKNHRKNREWQTIVEEEKMKILYCLYSLKEIMHFFHQVDIFLINDIPFIDIEMTDDMIALEFFRTRTDYKRYPLTIIYENKKAYYESYEFYLECEKGRSTHIKGADLTVDYIIDLSKRAGIKNLTDQQLIDCCDKEIFTESEQYI